MITKISGNLLRLDDDSATLAIEAFEYQVFIAESTRRALQPLVGQPISLHTISPRRTTTISTEAMTSRRQMAKVRLRPAVTSPVESVKTPRSRL